MVGNVLNATLPQHEVGLSIPNMSSVAIPLQGYCPRSFVPGSMQHQVYSSESTYGQPQGGYNNGMGLLISRFAVGVITAAALYTNQSLWFSVPGQ